MAETRDDRRRRQFAQRLRNWIDDRGLTQAQAAEFLSGPTEIKVVSIQKYLSADDMPRDGRLKQFERRTDGELVTHDLLANPPAADEATDAELVVARALIRSLADDGEVSDSALSRLAPRVVELLREEARRPSSD